MGDGNDNCDDDVNSEQSDVDGDGLDDACDADADNDGVANIEDNCDFDQNPLQFDGDGDGQGDECDQDLELTPLAAGQGRLRPPFVVL